MNPFEIFLALTVVATVAVYVACMMHPQNGAEERDDHSRPAH
jgi:hypothetical protein